jgi:hypothetical protein
LINSFARSSLLWPQPESKIRKTKTKDARFIPKRYASFVSFCVFCFFVPDCV